MNICLQALREADPLSSDYLFNRLGNLQNLKGGFNLESKLDFKAHRFIYKIYIENGLKQKKKFTKLCHRLAMSFLTSS